MDNLIVKMIFINDLRKQSVPTVNKVRHTERPISDDNHLFQESLQPPLLGELRTTFIIYIASIASFANEHWIQVRQMSLPIIKSDNFDYFRGWILLDGR